MRVIGAKDVERILAGRETAIIDLVDRTYQAHSAGKSAVPHSLFLRFPGNTRDRIIALPAFAGGDSPVAGMKWVASFPRNIDNGLRRASASIVLNSLETGFPEALVEGSLISAKRTAASAALAARLFTLDAPPSGVAVVGSGVINLEVVRFLKAALPSLSEVSIFDANQQRAESFAEQCEREVPGVGATVAADRDHALAAHDLVSIATTAPKPHMDLDAGKPGSVVLHVSLRDLYAETILSSQNVVDDPDHVCREGTSPHLAEQMTGDRRFIDASIGDILRGATEFRRDPGRPLVFSPFGLGALDMALAGYVRTIADREGLGVVVEDFLPQS
jgi:N-[(2S)-2-amino-2-carboxyethyl]-L-glutamate dehydrogenase